MAYILKYTEPIQWYLLFTTLVFAYLFNKKKTEHRFLLYILMLLLATEITATVLRVNNSSFGLVYTLSVILHHSIWINLLVKKVDNKRFYKMHFYAFLIFSLGNLLFYEGYSNFNYYTFVVGSLIYLLVFLLESFINLKKENLAFFEGTDYLLLFVPILFFLGFSFIFGFQSWKVSYILVFDKIPLYKIIMNFSSIIYYTLIIIYVYKEKKISYAS